MVEFLARLLSVSIGGSILIVVVILLRMVLRKAPKKYICLLWLLAAVRLLLPFQMESPFSLQPQFVQKAPTYLQQHVQTTPIQQVTPPEFSTPVDATVPPIETLPTAPSVAVTAPTFAAPVDIWQLAVWIWAAGGVILLMYSTLSYFRLCRRVRNAVIYSDGVWITNLDTAVVMGFLRPKIYLSAALTQDQLELVLQHEKCHIRRGDHIWKPLGFIVPALHWMNPLVWVGYWLLCRDLEMACDEAVIRNLDISQRKSYSAALLSCSAQRHAISACPVAFGEVSVKDRIVNVMNYKKPAFWMVLLTVAIIVAVAVCFLTSPEQFEPKSDDWGISVVVENITPAGVTLRFTQSGAVTATRYWCSADYALERWDGGIWETVPQHSEATNSDAKTLLAANGETPMTVDWHGSYGQLPDGQYRISKWISTDDGTSIRYYAPFTIGLLSNEQILSLLYDAMAQLQSMDSYYERFEYIIETEFPYLIDLTVEDWYSDGQWYRSREARFAQGTVYYDYLNANGVTYYKVWSEDLADINSPWMVREDFTTENFQQGSIMYIDWSALEVQSITAENTDNGPIYTVRLLTGVTGDATMPVYESYFTFQMDANASIISIRHYCHCREYFSGWGRSGYWDTKFEISFFVEPLNPAVLEEKLSTAMVEIESAKQ